MVDRDPASEETSFERTPPTFGVTFGSGSLSEPPDRGNAPLEPGVLIGGRYRVLRPIAQGGFGEVHEVLDLRTQTSLALKLHRSAARNAWAVAALRGEFAVLATLRHPNLAEVHDFGWFGESAYFTQALVPGVRLDRADLDLSSPRALDLLAQLCRALDYLHARGILHRDVKPSNVVVDLEREHLVLLDFGISRAFGHADGRTVVGTYTYIAPEAIRGQPLDGRSDLYSLGATLYKLASGRVPFPARGREPAELLFDHLSTVPPPLPDTVLPGIARVIERLLAKEPAERFATPSEVLDALGAALGRPVTHDTPETLASYVLSAAYVEPPGLLTEIETESASPGARPLAILGEAGTGKSRLARELRHRVQTRGGAWVAVQARRDDPAHLLLRDVAEAVLTSEVAAAIDEFDRVELARGLPALRRKGERIAVPVDPERARQLRIEALGRAIALRFAPRPGFLVIEDLHRADEHVALQVAALVAAVRAAGAHCRIAVTCRPSAPATAFLEATGAGQVTAQPLSAEGCRTIVRTTFGDPDLLAGTALGEALAHGSHPVLWVQESLRLAVEQGRIVRREGRFGVEGEVPALGPEEVLAARVRALGRPGQLLALACAVWGGPASAEELARVAGGPLERAAGGLRDLVRAGLVEEERDARERVTYAMHDRYAEIVPGLFSQVRARALHLRASRVLLGSGAGAQATGAAAGHLAAAGDAEGAREGYLRAAREAERTGRPDLSLRWIDRARAVDPSAERVADHLLRVDVATMCGARDAVAESLSWLVHRAPTAPAPEQLEIALRRARRAASEGQGDAARRFGEQALEIALALGDRGAEARARLALADVESMFGALDRAAETYRVAAALATEHGDRELQARAWLGASLADVSTGRVREGMTSARQAVRASATSRDLALRSEALRQLGNAAREGGRVVDARTYYRRAVETARACGCLEREAKALNNLGTVAHWLGDVDAATLAFERSIALKERAGAAASALVGYNNVAVLQLALGQRDAARATLDRILVQAPDDRIVVRPIALSNLGDLEAIEGNLDAALRHYREGLRACRARSFALQEGHALANVARALTMRAGPGDLEEAAGLLRDLDALAARLDMAESKRRLHATRSVLAAALGLVGESVDAARLAVASRDRITRFSEVFNTPIEVRWILALALFRAGRERAAGRVALHARRELLRLAGMLSTTEQRDGFLDGHPLHAAILASDLDLPPGWTWRPRHLAG